MEGIVKGVELAGILRIGKGETASVDEMLGSPKSGYGFDLAGILIGSIRKKDADIKIIKPGFLIVGFCSSGPHCNGYTSLRHKLLNGDFEERSEIKKLYEGRFSLNDKIPETNQTIGETLLKPTIIYSRAMKKIGEQFPYIQGINITGYGLKNFNRVGEGVRYQITDPFEPQPIFNLYKKETGEPDEKIYESLNMGLGFALIVRLQDANEVIKIASESGHKTKVIGGVTISNDGKNRTILHKGRKEILFEGYQ